MGWKEATLGELGKVSMCKRILKDQTLPVGDIPFYKIGTFGKTANAFIPAELFEEYRARFSFPKVGDILISASGTIGRCVVYDGKPAYFQDSNIVWIDNDEKLVANEYLLHFYGACNWNPSKGATISRLYNDDLRKIKINFPSSILEQQRIVAILDQAFADIEKARANAEKNLKNARELFDSYLNQVFSQRGEGWVEKPLGDVICKTHTKDPRKNPELKFLYVDVSSVSNTTLEITEATELLGKDAPSRARRVISEGNVIFATVRPTLKRIAIVPNRLDGEICSTGYFVFETSDELNNRYLYYFLQSYCFMGEMEKLQSGASYPAVNDSQVKQTIIKYPSITEQQSIVVSMDKLSKQVQQLEKGCQEKLDSLEELKKSLLQKAFSGELTKTEGHAA